MNGGAGGADYTVLVVFESSALERFLVARHRDRGWELPGGRVEPGEALPDAARREWEEETGMGLAALVPVLLHERPDGSRGHIFLGVASGSPRGGAAPGEKIEAVRYVARLREVSPLAFPDDPYADMAAAIVNVVEGGGPWSLPKGERPEAFIERLSRHDEAHPKGHRVSPHPLAR